MPTCQQIKGNLDIWGSIILIVHGVLACESVDRRGKIHPCVSSCHAIAQGLEHNRKGRGKEDFFFFLSLLERGRPSSLAFESWNWHRYPHLPRFSGLWPQTGNYTIGFLGSGAFGLGQNRANNTHGSPTCRQPIVEFLCFHSLMNQFP